MAERENKYECPNCHSEYIQRFEVVYEGGMSDLSLTTFGCFSSSIFPHFRHSTSPLSSWEIPHFQQALSGYRFHNCVLPHKGMFHSVASSTSHQEMAVVSQSVNHGSGHLFIGEDAAPF